VLFATSAGAQKAERAAHLSVTEAATVLYAVDNRDFAPNDLATVVNDDWGVFYNRLNAQATRGGLRLGLRLDTAWFFRSPDPTAVALMLVERRPPDPFGPSNPVYFRGKVYEAGGELSNRYINWTYPAKIYIGYNARNIDVTVGDFYAELGRGFVLSVRKRDELASDDSIRGIRVTASPKLGPVGLRLTALGGSPNPIRIDEGSGRYLGVHRSALPGFLKVTEAGMPRAIETDFADDTGRCETTPTCSYAPDRVVGGQVVLELAPVELGSQGSLLIRQPALSPDVVRSADRVLTLSQSVNAATSDGRLSLYVEGALQKLQQDDLDRELPAGHALYASGTVTALPFLFLFEARHYRRFFPLRAQVSTDRAREFGLLAFNAPPTTEDPTVDTEMDNFNTCVSGGRARADAALRPGVSALGWLGYYETFAESVSNDRCDTSRENRNRVIDSATGFELTSRDHKRRASLTAGSRFDFTDRALPVATGSTQVFYREVYARYQLALPLTGPFTLEVSGLHRRRRRLVDSVIGPYHEGEHLAALDVGRDLSVGVGFEYNSDPEPPTTYVNGNVRYRPTPDSSVTLFAGQRRASLRCIGGLCQVRPGFEGVRLDGSVSF
jgi:hypothetical protein